MTTRGETDGGRTDRSETEQPTPAPVRSVTAESAVTESDVMWLIAAGSDPHDEKRSILRYPADIEPTLNSLARITGLLPQILDQLSVLLADRQRHCAFAVDDATEAGHGPDVEPETVTAAQLLTDAVPAAQ